jgi:tRNA threonylcarbamoyladenosine biosynthesis protein TsaB
MAPRLLALDTSTEQMSVALCDGARRWWREEPGGARASARLLPLVAELLAEAGLRHADLDGIAFGRGPGAFTGLRTSCAVAQGLGFGLDLPVLPLDSLMLVAEAERLAHGTAALWVAMDARMEEAYAGAYRFENAAWQVLSAPALYTLPALRRRWQDEHGTAGAPGRVAGSARSAYGERLGLPAGPVQPEGGVGRAQALLSLASQRWPLGEAVDAAQALPLYLRDKVALTSDERAAQKAEKAAAAVAP